MYFIVFVRVAVELDFNIMLMPNFSNLLDLADLPPLLVFGVDIVALLKFVEDAVVFELVCVLPEHVSLCYIG